MIQWFIPFVCKSHMTKEAKGGSKTRIAKKSCQSKNSQHVCLIILGFGLFYGLCIGVYDRSSYCFSKTDLEVIPTLHFSIHTYWALCRSYCQTSYHNLMFMYPNWVLKERIYNNSTFELNTMIEYLKKVSFSLKPTFSSQKRHYLLEYSVRKAILD